MRLFKGIESHCPNISKSNEIEEMASLSGSLSMSDIKMEHRLSGAQRNSDGSYDVGEENIMSIEALWNV